MESFLESYICHAVNRLFYNLPLFLGFFKYNLVTSEMKSSGLASFVRLLSSQVSFPMTWLKLWHLASCLQASKQ